MLNIHANFMIIRLVVFKKPLLLSLPYLTLPSGRTGVSCPALRSYLFGPASIPDVTVGHSSLLVVLTNRIRERGLTLLSSSNSSRYDPKVEYLCCILVERVPKKWNAVSSSSPHAEHSGSLRNFMPYLAMHCSFSILGQFKRFLHVFNEASNFEQR